MPYPERGETKEEYISRCIPYMIKNEGKKQDQAVAMCHAFWKQYSVKEEILLDDTSESSIFPQYKLCPECKKRFKLKDNKVQYNRFKCPNCHAKLRKSVKNKKNLSNVEESTIVNRIDILLNEDK
jgi:hypothetical protein